MVLRQTSPVLRHHGVSADEATPTPSPSLGSAKQHWRDVLRFMQRLADPSLASSEHEAAVRSAALALLSHDSAQQIMECERESGFHGGYAPLVSVARRLAKKDGDAALRADAHCVLAILGTSNPSTAAAHMGAAVRLREAHCRQHLLLCGMQMHAPPEEGGLKAALAEARTALGCAGSECERWEATGMIASCMLELGREAEAQHELERYVNAGLGLSDSSFVLQLGAKDNLRALAAAYRLATLLAKSGDVPAAEHYILEAEKRERHLTRSMPDAQLDVTAKETARAELQNAKRTTRWKRMSGTFSWRGSTVNPSHAQAAVEMQNVNSGLGPRPRQSAPAANLMELSRQHVSSHV
ncbi:hypothetical protein AB1Y20_023037 [Prymnesium parvum]|uniref:Anaphase-promoting complex subunit 5 n=1 Tax=Prymnesium parvum TaxID=97485 RepID=A0AB34JEB2_PRYPA